MYSDITGIICIVLNNDEENAVKKIQIIHDICLPPLAVMAVDIKDTTPLLLSPLWLFCPFTPMFRQ